MKIDRLNIYVIDLSSIVSEFMDELSGYKCSLQLVLPEHVVTEAVFLAAIGYPASRGLAANRLLNQMDDAGIPPMVGRDILEAMGDKADILITKLTQHTISYIDYAWKFLEEGNTVMLIEKRVK